MDEDGLSIPCAPKCKGFGMSMGVCVACTSVVGVWGQPSVGECLCQVISLISFLGFREEWMPLGHTVVRIYYGKRELLGRRLCG
jgi:hypothetical protein